MNPWLISEVWGPEYLCQMRTDMDDCHYLTVAFDASKVGTGIARKAKLYFFHDNDSRLARPNVILHLSCCIGSVSYNVICQSHIRQSK